MTHTPDIMEKARELAIKIDEDCCKELSGTDFMAGYSSNITKMTSLIAAALAEARAVPDGWRLVPVEPAEEMKKRGALAFYESKNSLFAARIPDIYGAMIAAAPNPPITGCGK